MEKIIIYSLIGVCILAGAFFIYSNTKQDLRYCDSQNIKTDYTGEKLCYEEPIYQGAVRPTDDEEHFRKTGQTIPKVVKK